MQFTKYDLTYEKRPLTKDIALFVISNSIPKSKEEKESFVRQAFPYKSGELAAQVDSCPVAKLEDLRKAVDFLKRTYEGFRIRHAQLSGIAAVNDTVGPLDDDTAALLIAAGSIAVAAKGYKDGADKVLLSHGILPLVSYEEIKENTFLLIRNIRKDDEIVTGEQDAYIVTPENQVSVNIGIGEYTKKELEKLL